LFLVFFKCFLKDEQSDNEARIKRAYQRGQTQSQYLSFSNDDDGKAEAEATQVISLLEK
jgi:hypothetical protein